MACCLLVSLFVGGIWNRSAAEIAAMTGSSHGASRPDATGRLAKWFGPRWRLWLALLAVAEIGAAFLVAVVLSRLVRPQQIVMQMEMTPTSSIDFAVAGALALLLFLSASMVTLGDRSHGVLGARWSSPRAAAALAALVYLMTVLPAARDLAHRSQTVSMLQMMLLLVAAPALLSQAIARTRSGPPLTERTIRLAAPAAGIAYTLIVYLWHLPAVHAASMSVSGFDWLRLTSLAAVGLALWGPLLTDRRPELAGVRLSAVVAAGVPSGILGIAMLVVPHVILPMAGHATLGLDALTDQRLAGAVMMVADLVLLLPVAKRVAGEAPQATVTA